MRKGPGLQVNLWLPGEIGERFLNRGTLLILNELVRRSEPDCHLTLILRLGKRQRWRYIGKVREKRSEPDETVSHAASVLGARGGASGTPAGHRRGDSAYYRRLAIKSTEVRLRQSRKTRRKEETK
jgi:hypothetical protein